MKKSLEFKLNKGLREDVNALGTFLVGNGFKGKNVAILGGDPYEWTRAYLSVVLSAAIAVPLDGGHELHVLKRLVNAADCSCIVYAEGFEGVVWDLYNDGVTDLQTSISMGDKTTGEIFLSGEEACFPAPQISYDDLALIQFESETAYRPKPALMTHGNIENLLFSLKEVVDSDRRGVFFSALPVNRFMARILGLLHAIYFGEDTSFEGVAPQITALNSSVADQTSGLVGRALPGIEANIRHPDSKTGIGEIVFKGASLSPGYYNKPDFGDKKYPSPYRDDWYLTGHRGTLVDTYIKL
jgi:acyl-CoA synthetase (AMP-forming)/AMP-acid ligase II